MTKRETIDQNETNRDEWIAELNQIRHGTHHILTDATGVPTVASHLPLMNEMYELIEAMATGYNALVSSVARMEHKLDMVRKIIDSYNQSEQRRKEGKL